MRDRELREKRESMNDDSEKGVNDLRRNAKVLRMTREGETGFQAEVLLLNGCKRREMRSLWLTTNRNRLRLN